jgi:hypothetical protein
LAAVLVRQGKLDEGEALSREVAKALPDNATHQERVRMLSAAIAEARKKRDGDKSP